jgi:uncharacterized protein (DUF2062 family)
MHLIEVLVLLEASRKLSRLARGFVLSGPCFSGLQIIFSYGLAIWLSENLIARLRMRHLALPGKLTD